MPARVGVFLACAVVCFGTAGIGAAVTAGPVREWYPTIRKPSWNPPDWVFGPVWTTLFAMMAVAAWLVWYRAGFIRARWAFALFGVQLVLNASWSGLFFALHRPDLAFVEIVFLWLAIAATVVAFCRFSQLAAGLLVPYWLWVTFAAALNGTIWSLNV